MSTIKNRLKILRTDEGITQDELAQIINEKLKEKENEKPISKMVISNWENNKHTIKPDKAQLLADHFGVSTGFLLGFGTMEEELEYDKKEMYKLFQKEDDALLSLGYLLSDNDIEYILQLIHLLSSKNEAYFWKSFELNDPNKLPIFENSYSSFSEVYPDYLDKLQKKYNKYLEEMSKKNRKIKNH